MKLCVLSDISLHGQWRVFRQGRRMSVAMTLILGGILIGAAIFWRQVGAPWFVWGSCAVLALFIVPLLLGDLAQKFRPTNWLLLIRGDGVSVNFRSYQDRGPIDVPCVLHLEFADIVEARERREIYTTPSGDDSTHNSLQSLELMLAHDVTAPVIAAMKEDRRRNQPSSSYAGVRVTTPPSHFAVTLPAANCVRLAWRGGTGHWVAPSLKVALAELSQYVVVGDRTTVDHGDWRDLSEEELDNQILQLAQRGDAMNAVKLLTARRGMTTTDAKRFVDELLTTSE